MPQFRRWAPVALLATAVLVVLSHSGATVRLWDVVTAPFESNDPAGAFLGAAGAAAGSNRPAPLEEERAATDISEAWTTGACAASRVLRNTELAGETVRWGADHLVDRPAECCRACLVDDRCNVWVHCPDGSTSCTPRQCWLKRQALTAGMQPGSMQAPGPGVPWTSGVFVGRPMKDAAALTPVNSSVEDSGDGSGVAWTITITKVVNNTATKCYPPARQRECGSPAVDGYAHVDAKCLEDSITAREFDHRPEVKRTQVVWVEQHASYDGLAVAWGIGNKHSSAASCAAACRAHTPSPSLGPFGKLPCNAFVWCPTGVGERCFEPDAHTHTPGDCWLKFTEVPECPEVNARGDMTAEHAGPETVVNGRAYNQRYPELDRLHGGLVPWVSGVLLPPGHVPCNGTWGPRVKW